MSSATINGIAIEGIERDLELTYDRHFEEIQVAGFAPRLIPLYPSCSWDEVDLTFTAWCSSSAAAQLELLMPPYHQGAGITLAATGLSGVPAFPGFGNYNAGYWILRNLIATKPMESMGRKGPRVDLFGYRFSFRMAANGYGSTNERGGVVPSDATVPDIVSKKFMAHQLQDQSNLFAPIPSGSAPEIGAVHHGRRQDANMLFDHISVGVADQLSNFFRAVRNSPFMLTNQLPFGPGLYVDTTPAIAKNLTISRRDGWWEAQLALSRLAG